MRVRVYSDGGLVVIPESVQANVATLAGTKQWVQHARETGNAVVLEGDLDDPTVAALVEELRAAAGGDVTVENAHPEPLRKRYTTMMWAAQLGRVDLVTDLLARGSSADPPRRTLRHPFRPPSPFELAIAGGHFEVMAALRNGGVDDPVRTRPPDAPDALVIRARVGWIAYRAAAVIFAIMMPIALIARSPEAALTGAAIAVGCFLIGAITDLGLSRAVIAVDGQRVWTRRFIRWNGPLAFSDVIALGLSESSHFRTATLVRLGNRQHGTPASRPTLGRGFDDEQIAALRQLPDGRVLSLYVSQLYGRPGVERYVAARIDRSTTTVSDSAEKLFDGR